ncbi:MAG: sigma-54-dependent Fis family transcriptional regulator [Rhodospirillaceae bacterium]|nr:sigma-54-dependent Fis family transcriptional regulator [Rhodospirillales bacterium]
MYCENTGEASITKEMIASLGVEVLASILLEQAGRDPAVLDRLKPALKARLSPNISGDPPMVGASPALRRLQTTIGKVAITDAPVLITGESGTGKELAAVSIHKRSPRAMGPFVPINCAALPKALIASELFGHEKGAFTGADQRRIGRLQAADRGTVFLDEIGDLPMDLQAHLLRFLQESTIDRIGGVHPIKVDVRVVAATNVPLRKAVAEGRFREDLYFRLNVLTIEMPPLRERGEDIDPLVAHFVAKFCRDAGKTTRSLSPDAAALLRRYAWPGNIRELIATIRRAVVMADGDTIRPEDLALPAADDGNLTGLISLDAARRGAEESLIRQTLATHRHNVKRTAEHLGVSRVTLYRLLDKYGIAYRAE